MIHFGAVCERPRRYRVRPPFRESELSLLWEAQQFPPEAIVTDSGQDVTVLYRGRRGAGPGPDFRDAAIALAGGRLLKGDVELHVRSSDFQRHGHHLDRGYQRLVLHVVFEHDGGPTLVLDGREVPIIALGRWVQRRAGELRATLADPGSYREPCHTAVARLGEAAAVGELSEIGARRLREKAARLLLLVESAGPTESLYRATARALGLTRNCAQMEAVSTALPLAELNAIAADAADRELLIEAALLGTGGLLNGQTAMWADAEAVREQRLLTAWQALGGQPLRLEWDATPNRPGCGPRERLAGLAALVGRDGPPLNASKAEWLELLSRGPRATMAVLQTGSNIGRDRAIEIAVNAVLPWLLAAYKGDAELEASAVALYQELPGPVAYGATRLLTSALVDAEGRPLVRGAAAVQGALQMTRDWCTRGGCGRCPLS